MFIAERARSCDRKAVSLNGEKKLKPDCDTNMNDPSGEVDRSECNLKSNFRSQNPPDLDWSKGTQPYRVICSFSKRIKITGESHVFFYVFLIARYATEFQIEQER